MSSWIRRKSSGRIWIIILVVVALLFFLFVLVPLFLGVRHASPVVEDAYWTTDDAHVVQALRGEQIVAFVKVKASESYSGSIVVKVRKDVAHWTDIDYEVSTFPVDLAVGEEKVVTVTFTPDESTSSSLRGYFIQVEFPDTGGSWTMGSSYPPRLRVYD